MVFVYLCLRLINLFFKMNKNTIAFSVAVLLTLIGFSQNKEKIKGNKSVTNRITDVGSFSRLVFGENFKITLIQGCAPSVEVSTDENLHDVINFAVLNGSLKFNTNKRIASNKALDIRVIYTDALKVIELTDNGELTSATTLKIDTLKLSTSKSAKAFLNLQTNSFTFTNSGKSKSELNLMTDSANIKLSDNSNLEALITASSIKIDMHQSSDAIIEGDTKSLSAYVDNSSKLNAENLTTKDCTLTVKEKADAKVEAANSIILDVTGDTETIIYGKPKVTLKNFKDNAVLIKKDKNG